MFILTMFDQLYSYISLYAHLVPDIRAKIHVHLVNFVGLDEAGVDGGGLFRELMSELLKTAFDPNRGIFISIPGQEPALYPNPAAASLFDVGGDTAASASYVEHYWFLGRIVGKALYEGLLADLPFAQFFLAKLLARPNTSWSSSSGLETLSIDYLDSLDPVLYK